MLLSYRQYERKVISVVSEVFSPSTHLRGQFSGEYLAGMTRMLVLYRRWRRNLFVRRKFKTLLRDHAPFQFVAGLTNARLLRRTSMTAFSILGFEEADSTLQTTAVQSSPTGATGALSPCLLQLSRNFRINPR